MKVKVIMVLEKAMEFFIIQMEVYFMENGTIIPKYVAYYFIIQIIINILEDLKII